MSKGGQPHRGPVGPPEARLSGAVEESRDQRVDALREPRLGEGGADHRPRALELDALGNATAAATASASSAAAARSRCTLILASKRRMGRLKITLSSRARPIGHAIGNLLRAHERFRCSKSQ